MARRRKFQWVDAIVATPVALVGAAAPGTLVSSTIITENELENVGGGATLMRVVGQIITGELQNKPVVTHTLFVFENYVGSALPADWDNDTFQRAGVLGTWMVFPGSNTLLTVSTEVDLRTKRKLGQGVTVLLHSQNHAIANQDAEFVFHLRCLLLLP